MSAVEEIIAGLPIEDLAEQLGTDPASLTSAATAVLPALLGGLAANVEDPAGATSLAGALSQHGAPVDPRTVNLDDGTKIVQHIFGNNTENVTNQLGGLDGHPHDLVQKVIPILAPIVLSYLAKQVLGQSGSGGILGTVLGEVLKGAGQGTATRGGTSAGSILGDVLGGLLGGGRR